MAFYKVLDALLSGATPKLFRAYLLTTLRHLAYDNARLARRLQYVDDLARAPGVGQWRLTVSFRDAVVAEFDRSRAALAFATLPERWRFVLWHNEVEDMAPEAIAPLMGLSPNGVSALAYRAREGLRRAYLQVHLKEVAAQRCKPTVDQLAARVRGGLSKTRRDRVDAHLNKCSACRSRFDDLAELNGCL